MERKILNIFYEFNKYWVLKGTGPTDGSFEYLQHVLNEKYFFLFLYYTLNMRYELC